MLLDVAGHRRVAIIDGLAVIRKIKHERIPVGEFAENRAHDEIIVENGVRVLRDLRALRVAVRALRRGEVVFLILREQVRVAEIIEAVAAHEVHDIKILAAAFRHRIVQEREKLLIERRVLLVRLAHARECVRHRAVREQRRDVAPDARALLVRQPVRRIPRRVHDVDEVVRPVPCLPGRHALLVSERQDFLQRRDRRALRADDVAEDGDVPFCRELVEIRRVLERIAVEVQPPARRRFAEEEDDLRRVAFVFRDRRRVLEVR